MTLYDILQAHKDDEISVSDNDYDILVYFYYSDDNDIWNQSMMDLSRLLTVKEDSTSVSVDLSGLIEKHLSDLDDLFISCDLDDIMDDIENVLSGYVSEKWLRNFVDILEKD